MKIKTKGTPITCPRCGGDGTRYWMICENRGGRGYTGFKKDAASNTDEIIYNPTCAA